MVDYSSAGKSNVAVRCCFPLPGRTRIIMIRELVHDKDQVPTGAEGNARQSALVCAGWPMMSTNFRHTSVCNSVHGFFKIGKVRVKCIDLDAVLDAKVDADHFY